MSSKTTQTLGALHGRGWPLSLGLSVPASLPGEPGDQDPGPALQEAPGRRKTMGRQAAQITLCEDLLVFSYGFCV